MGWLSKIKSALSGKGKGLNYADVMSGRTPIYSAFGRDIYASDVVTQATQCVTNEIMKLAPVHVISHGTDIVPAPAGDPLQRVLNNPNHYMTTADFLSKVMYTYFSKSNSWVIPTYRVDSLGRRTYTGLYPVDPTLVTWYEDPEGTLLVELQFNRPDFDKILLPYSDVIHLRRNYGAAEYMGGGVDGLPDDRALLTTLEINHQMLGGISKAMKASQSINGIVKYGSILSREKNQAAIQEFEQKVRESLSGFVGLDLQDEFIPIKRDIKLVDADTLKFIDEKILRNIGVPLPILTGDYSKEQYEAFYQKTIETIILIFSQGFNRVLFTPTQESYGHKIQFFAKELIFMSIDQKINMINLLAPTGAMFENEKRVAFGMHPLEELSGKRYMSLNWIDATQANEYQAGKAGTSGQDNGGTENE